MSISREQIEKPRTVTMGGVKVVKGPLVAGNAFKHEQDRRAEIQMMLTLIRRYPEKAKEYCCNLQDSVV